MLLCCLLLQLPLPSSIPLPVTISCHHCLHFILLQLSYSSSLWFPAATIVIIKSFAIAVIILAAVAAIPACHHQCCCHHLLPPATKFFIAIPCWHCHHLLSLLMFMPFSVPAPTFPLGIVATCYHYCYQYHLLLLLSADASVIIDTLCCLCNVSKLCY